MQGLVWNFAVGQDTLAGPDIAYAMAIIPSQLNIKILLGKFSQLIFRTLLDLVPPAAPMNPLGRQKLGGDVPI